ncbi:MAG TPA: hypothetical protein VHG52_08735 [Thermomicrobiales bacterium]|nr:hypothetical protein [Thermomicrobiales bacterium]
MAQTSGLVQRLKWLSAINVVIVSLGPAASAVQVFILRFDPGDLGVLASRRAMSVLLERARAAGLPVTLTHAAGATEIEGVDVRVAPVRVDAIEVTQAVQNLNHAVELVALKPTVVRVYLSSRLPAATTLTGVLSVTRPGASSRLVASLDSVNVDPAAFGQVNTLRRDRTRSLNFLLPPDQTAAGTLEIRLASLTDTGSGAAVTFGPPGNIDTFAFTTAAPMRLCVVGFSYQFGAPAQSFTPGAVDFGLLSSWLRRAYPVAQVIVSQQIVTANAAPPFNCGDINAQLAAIRALDVSAGVDGRTHYYGLVHDGGFFMRGCATIAFSADPTAVSSGPTGPATWGWDNDGSYGDWYGGHELGHTFGRLHPGFCGESHDDPNYPFTAGQLASSDGSYAGFDVGDVIWGRPMAALPGIDWHDVMTYCNQQWLSSYTYRAIRTRLAAENALGAGAGGGSGRPDDRFPEGVEAGVREERIPQQRPLVSLVAQVNLTQGTGRISFVNPVARGSVSQPEAATPVTIRSVDGDGKVLAEFPASVKPLSDLPQDSDHEAIVDAVIPIEPATTAIELYVSDRLADSYQFTGQPPEIGEIRGERAEGEGIQLAWASGRARGSVHYNVQVSQDGGRSWRTVAVGVQDPSVAIHPDNLIPDRPALIRVMATDGLRATESTIEWHPGADQTHPG